MQAADGALRKSPSKTKTERHFRVASRVIKAAASTGFTRWCDWVDDLLDVSRITMGKLELHKERVELATILQDAVEAGRALIDQQGHKAYYQVASRPGIARCRSNPTYSGTKIIADISTQST